MKQPCPINKEHETKLVILSPALSYHYCVQCKEDVSQLSAPAEEEEIEDDENEDVEEDLDEEFDPFTNPPGFNPWPQQNMGDPTAKLKVVLLNDQFTGHMVVENVLKVAFGKSEIESKYLMMEAHFRGRAEVFFINPPEIKGLFYLIDRVKAVWKVRGLASEHIDGLKFVVEKR